MTFIETKRLVLRNVAAKDADIMFDYRSNELCARYQRGQIKDREGIGDLVERRKNDILSVDAPFMSSIALASYQTVYEKDIAGGVLMYIAQAFLLAGSIFGGGGVRSILVVLK